MSRKRKLHGKVQKLLKSSHPKEPEKAEIAIHEADDLYKEIRIDNVMHDDKGQEFQLKPGAKVDVVVEADSDATVKKPE